MGYEERKMPTFTDGDSVRVFVAGVWYAGRVVMSDPDNAIVGVELPKPLLPWPLGRVCYIRRDRPDLLRRHPMLLGEFATYVHDACGPVLCKYEHGEYSPLWRETLSASHITAMMNSMRRDFKGAMRTAVLKQFRAIAAAIGIDVPLTV